MEYARVGLEDSYHALVPGSLACWDLNLSPSMESETAHFPATTPLNDNMKSTHSEVSKNYFRGLTQTVYRITCDQVIGGRSLGIGREIAGQSNRASPAFDRIGKDTLASMTRIERNSKPMEISGPGNNQRCMAFVLKICQDGNEDTGSSPFPNKAL